MGLVSGTQQLQWGSATISHSHAKALSSERFSLQPKATQPVGGKALTHSLQSLLLPQGPHIPAGMGPQPLKWTPISLLRT